MSKGRREAPKSAAARLCEWRGLNCYEIFSGIGSASRRVRRENRACTNFTEEQAAEGAPSHEQRQARSAEKRGSAALRMARAEPKSDLAAEGVVT